MTKSTFSKALFLSINKSFALLLAFVSISASCDCVDLEKRCTDFVLEIMKIEIPGHPYAFNPSIVNWRGSLLLSFREIPLPYDSGPHEIASSAQSEIGLVFLNDDFTIDGPPFMLELPRCYIDGSAYGRAEDARLINIDEHLYIVYSDNPNVIITEGGFRIHVGELDFDGRRFFLKSLETLTSFPGESPFRREKNWVPFDYEGSLLLGYSINPHRVFMPFLDGNGECLEIASTSATIAWKWGELRGGTPALRFGSEYLAFFHSSIEIASVHSGGGRMPHYFMGAYTFQKNEPFSLTRISPVPIIGKGFYSGESYPYYWKPVQVVFPGGYIFDDTSIYLAYGRQDHEIWIARIDRGLLFDSLIPIETCQRSSPTH